MTSTYYSTRNFPVWLKQRLEDATVKLKRARKARGLTQEEVLFEAVGIGLTILTKGLRK